MNASELLSGLDRDVNIIIELVETEFIPLPLEILQWKERPDRWSVLECFEHLNRYSRYYQGAIAERLKHARPNETTEVKSTWLGKMFISMMHPKNRKRQKTIKRMDPSQSTLTKGVLHEFLQHQTHLLGLLKEAAAVDLNSLKVPVEFMKLLKMNGGDTLQFVVVHEQRHVNQAMAVKSKTATSKEPALKI